VAVGAIESGGLQPFLAVTIYGLLTAVVILATLLVMNNLGRQPLLQTSGRDRLPNGWLTVTGARRAFTLHIPPDWQRYEQAEELTTLLAQQAIFEQATYPLGRLAPDTEIIFAAVSPPRAPFSHPAVLVVARSARLNRLTVAQTIELVREQGTAVSEAEFVPNYDKSHVRILLEVPPAGDLAVEETLTCRQHVIAGQQESLLVAACSISSLDRLYRGLFTPMLDSFQRLSP
jgi:hypothetical protein